MKQDDERFGKRKEVSVLGKHLGKQNEKQDEYLLDCLVGDCLEIMMRNLFREVRSDEKFFSDE